MKHVGLGFAVVCFAAAAAWGQNPAALPKTFLTERGKLLLEDSLAKPFSKGWKAAKGKWEIVDGAMRGSELKSDMHGAVARHGLEFRNAVIQFSFKLEGAKKTTLSINKEKGHLCRVLIGAEGFSIQKDLDKKKTDDKPVVLDKRTVSIKPGAWHTMVVELLGTEMAASLDGKEVAFGAHDALDVAKANFGFTVAGESVSFKDLKVYEALPNKDWPAIKGKLRP